MELVLALVGAVIVLIVLLDVFFTVLFPDSGRGPVRRPLAHAVWRSSRHLARSLPQGRRQRLLTYIGPVQVASTIIAWVVLFVVGWAMIFQPLLGTQVVAASGRTETGWAAALYFSGYVLTTVGLGDVVPTSGSTRLLTVTEGAIGFTMLTLTLTYFMSVYPALTKRKTATLSLHRRTYSTGDPVEFLVGLADDHSMPQAGEHLASVAHLLAETLETHRAYPVLRYFHFNDDRYALARVLFIAFETDTLIRSALDRQSYRTLVSSPVVEELWDSAFELLIELNGVREPSAPHPQEEDRWRRRHREAARRLEAAGLRVADDPDVAADHYVALRRRWDAPLRDFAAAMVYDWAKVEVTASAGGPEQDRLRGEM